ncbi:MAG: efflux RND transporter periplasmic adaptor subunit [Acidobacteriota bacterium]|nr:efflux RND transporter periplasmic adaptor subunit [Acidobacteriota bacterium]
MNFRRLKILGLAAPLTILLNTGCGEEGSATEIRASKENALRPREVAVAPVGRRDFIQTLQSTGSLMPGDHATLSALVEGPLEAVLVDIGDSVGKGQVLFKTRAIDASLAVRSAEAALETSRAGLQELLAWRRSEEIDMLRAETARAEAEHQRLVNERDRAASLLERGAISRSEWEQARTSFETAEANVRISTERLRIAETGPTREAIQVAENRVTERETALAQAQQRLEDTSVRAPFGGIITGRFLHSGDYVRRADEVLEITDLSSLEAEMKAPERYSSLLKVGIPVTLGIESLLLQREGKVIAVNEAIDLDTRTFLVKVAIDNSDHSIKAGTFCTAVFQLAPVKDALSIPTAALREEGGRSLVWVADGEIARRVEVTTGERADDHIQIRVGLTGDELVIVEGAGALSEGIPLTVAFR